MPRSSQILVSEPLRSHFFSWQALGHAFLDVLENRYRRAGACYSSVEHHIREREGEVQQVNQTPFGPELRNEMPGRERSQGYDDKPRQEYEDHRQTRRLILNRPATPDHNLKHDRTNQQSESEAEYRFQA